MQPQVVMLQQRWHLKVESLELQEAEPETMWQQGSFILRRFFRNWLRHTAHLCWIKGPIVLPSSSGRKGMSGRIPTSSHFKDALKEVHKGAWDRWNLVKEQAGWKISDPSRVQTPGCIPEDIFEALADFIKSMPPPAKYAKM